MSWQQEGVHVGCVSLLPESELSANLLCEWFLEYIFTMIATPSGRVPVVYLVLYPYSFMGLGGRPLCLRRTMSGSTERMASEIGVCYSSSRDSLIVQV